mmetsp:Transcript_2945/g.9927  ORF Transcript_2945/g.9927 Transcript_2945/m.9927 type:complete len:125 (-) Transcript_2945:1224-1598(-)
MCVGVPSLEDLKRNIAENNDSVAGMLKEIPEIGQHATEHQEQEEEPDLGDVKAGALLNRSTVQCVNGDRAGVRHTQADQADLKANRISGVANCFKSAWNLYHSGKTCQRDTSLEKLQGADFNRA